MYLPLKVSTKSCITKIFDMLPNSPKLFAPLLFFASWIVGHTDLCCWLCTETVKPS